MNRTFFEFVTAFIGNNGIGGSFAFSGILENAERLDVRERLQGKQNSAYHKHKYYGERNRPSDIVISFFFVVSHFFYLSFVYFCNDFLSRRLYRTLPESKDRPQLQSECLRERRSDPSARVQARSTFKLPHRVRNP